MKFLNYNTFIITGNLACTALLVSTPQLRSDRWANALAAGNVFFAAAGVYINFIL